MKKNIIFVNNNNNNMKKDNQKTKLCSAFPGVGKTHFYKNINNMLVLDSDSSKFDKSKFPQNYVDHIQNLIGKVDIILISTHKEVRDELTKRGIFFNLIYPDKSLKNEYIERYEERGSDENFIKLIDKHWDNWIDELSEQEGCNKIILKSGEYLSDIMDRCV
jgi:hypothetical protein